MRVLTIGGSRPELMTVKEFAHAARMHPEYVRELCRKGKLEGAVKIGGGWRIDFDANVKAAGQSHP